MLVLIGQFSFTRIITDFLDKYDKGGIDEFAKLMVTWRGRILTIVLIVLCTYTVYYPKTKDKYISESSYPVDAANFLISKQETGSIDFSEMRLFNDYNYGSYLLYRGIPVFIDSRADLYSPEFNKDCTIFDDYMSLSGIREYYEKKFNKYKITHAMTYTDSKINLFFSRDENLEEIYKDDHFVIYKRLNVNTGGGDTENEEQK